MAAQLAHFAIAADDVARARRFYEVVFDWRFEAWGPPNFYQIHGAGVHGALQERAEPAADASGMVPQGGFECTFAVVDLAASGSAIEAAGGALLDREYEIPGVGRLRRFADTEGNEALIMQYEPQRSQELGLTLER